MDSSTSSSSNGAFAEEFGEQEYDVARDVLARVVGLLDQGAAEEAGAEELVPVAG